MNWLVRFYLRNDTPQKWFELIGLAVRLCIAVAMFVCGALGLIWIFSGGVEHFTR